MIYIRKIYNQDIDANHQMQIVKEPAYSFFNFPYNPTEKNLEDMSFTLHLENFFSENGVEPIIAQPIITRIYQSSATKKGKTTCEARLGSDLRNYLKANLQFEVGDILVLRNKKGKGDIDYANIYVDYVSSKSPLYQAYNAFLQNENHCVAIASDDEDDSQKKALDKSLQQIFYGAPGTGKSFIIDENTNESNRIRTTFHPDYDYATFVGAYKPTVKMANKYGLFGKDTVALKNEDDSPIKEDVIVYKFIPQAFIKAYVEAWRRYADTECTDKDFYLVIEEINRGNCAQIFGDLFQLLDRTNAGFSSYAVETESDLQDFLTTDEKYKLDIVLTEDIKNDNGKIIATAENVMNGKVLVLPPNLHIWATMNTSDQSLFPIDSAFKRRWEWKYVPIEYGNKEWKVVLSDNTECEWTELQQTLNDLIYDATDSEDKMLGDWFVKANGNEINEDQLVGKIIFYLWNDVAKVDAGKLFDLEIEKNGRKRKVIFSDFYEIDGSVSTVIVKSWLNNIGIELIEINSDTEDNSRNRYKLNNGALESLKDIANHVVRDFANNNPTMNAQQIRDIFVDAYKGCGISHIVETDEEYKLREGQSSLKRSASTVILPNGEIVHVSTQLRAKNEGDNFFNFIKVTKEKGWGEITE